MEKKVVDMTGYMVLEKNICSTAEYVLFIPINSGLRIVVLHAISPDSFLFPFFYQKSFIETVPAVMCKPFFLMNKYITRVKLSRKNPKKPTLMELKL